MEAIQKQDANPLTFQRQPEKFLKEMGNRVETLQQVYRTPISEPELELWRETLKSFSCEEFDNALRSLIEHPPKYMVAGEVQVWNGLPKLPDIVACITEMREERAAERRRRDQNGVAQEMRKLEIERREHPERFLDFKEVLQAVVAAKPEIKMLPDRDGKPCPAKIIPEEPVSTVLLGLDHGARQRELDRQKEILLRGKK